MRIETENRKMGEKSTGRNIPLLAEEGWLRHQDKLDVEDGVCQFVGRVGNQQQNACDCIDPETEPH